MQDSHLPKETPGPLALAGPVVAQAAFNAYWELLTCWRQRERRPASAFGDILGTDMMALSEVMYALVAAEQRARLEAGLPPSEEAWWWLQAALPGQSEVYSRLVELFASNESVLPSSPAKTLLRYSYFEEPLEPGDLGRFGHFRVIREVGRGGMAVVFEVENTFLNGRRRAIKLLEPSSSAPESKQRFRREALAMDQIQDDHVVRIYTAGEVNGVTYIEMEYIYGPTLEALIRHHLGDPLPLSLTADLIRQTASGLACAHGRLPTLAHRDVKPGNVLLEWVIEDDRYPFGWRGRVCDFGLAAEEDQTRLTKEGYIAGTTAYMAPEQLTQRSVVDGWKCDIFALGVIAYEMATGRHPFKGDTEKATGQNILCCQPQPPRQVNREIPESFERLIVQMVDCSPNNRPSAREIVVKMSELLGPDVCAMYAHTAAAPVSNSRLQGACEIARKTAAEPGDLIQQPTESMPAPAAEPLKLRLNITLWKQEDTTHGISIDDPKAVPLRPGDYARLEVRLNQPAYLYVLQLEANGDVAPLFPWSKYDWGQREVEQMHDRLDLPQDPLVDGVPLTNGPSGIEAFVVLARGEPLGEDENAQLKELFASGLRQAKFDPRRGVVWIDNDENRFSHEEDRARVDMKAAVQIEDPVAWLRRLLESDEMHRLIRIRRGVCYPFVGS